MYQKRGINVRVLSEALLVYHCGKKEVVFKESDGKCYEELTATYLGKKVFIEPISRLIVHQGKEIDCSTIFLNQFKISETWFPLIGGKLHESVNPSEIETIIPKPFAWKKISGLSHKGIYSPKDLELFKKSTLDAMHSKSNEIHVMRSLQGKSKLSPDLSIYNSLTLHIC